MKRMVLRVSSPVVWIADEARFIVFLYFVCRYYAMEIEYFMSSLASDVMGILTENFLWMRTLGSTPILENEVIRCRRACCVDY